MERFSYNDSNEYDDEQDMEAYLNRRSDIMEVMNMELLDKELNQSLLDQARKVASADILWFFRSDITKLRKITKVYKKLKKLSSEEE